MRQPVITLLPSASRTADGTGPELDLLSLASQNGNGRGRVSPWPPMLALILAVTGVTGTTPLLTCFLEDSVDDGANWAGVGQFAVKSIVSMETIRIGLRGDTFPAGFAWPFNASRVRTRWTISGVTPNFTFGVKGVLL